MNWKQIIDPFLQEVSCLTKLQASWNLLEHPGTAEERDFQPGFWWKSKCRIQLLVVLAAFFHGMKWSPADTAAHEKHVSRKQNLAPYMLNISLMVGSVWSSLSNSQQLTVFLKDFVQHFTNLTSDLGKDDPTTPRFRVRSFAHGLTNWILEGLCCFALSESICILHGRQKSSWKLPLKIGCLGHHAFKTWN